MSKTSSPGWLRRYRDGQQSQVWHELRQLGSTIHGSDHAEEAQLVCDEMALRARRNIELIVARLTEHGYQFHSNNDDRTPVVPFIPATAGAAEDANWLHDKFGMVPMTLLSWVRLVGDVWLVGTHPQWTASSSADPLVIQIEGSRYPESSMREYFEQQFDDWSEANESRSRARPFVMPLAPDRFHQENVSGGSPYGVVLPDGCVDGLFVGETTMPFVSYLNWVFSNGGFPWPSGSNDQWQILHDLRVEMLML